MSVFSAAAGRVSVDVVVCVDSGWCWLATDSLAALPSRMEAQMVDSLVTAPAACIGWDELGKE